MKKNEDLSICLHPFLGDSWWMDGKCFLLVKEYLDKYCAAKHELFENFVDKTMYVAVKRSDLIDYNELFYLEKLGERALMLSFTHVDLPNFEIFHQYRIEKRFSIQPADFRAKLLLLKRKIICMCDRSATAEMPESIGNRFYSV